MLKSLAPVTRMSTLWKQLAQLSCDSLHDNSSVGQACVQIDCNLGLTHDPPVTKCVLLKSKKHDQDGKNCLLIHQSKDKKVHKRYQCNNPTAILTA